MDSPKTKSGFSRGEWTKTTAEAHCLTCGWTCLKRNAHGAGARHARTHQHCVRIEISSASYYNHETS